MATINLGAIKFNWKGAYNSGTSYAVDDVVSSGGNSYVCIQAHSNQAVGNATAYWNIMSSAGTNGTNGTDISTTLTTQGDILYRDGSGLQRLAKPSSDKILQNTSGGVLSYIDAPSGKVKSITTSTDNTQRSTTSGSYTGAGNSMALTVTPESASSKFLISFDFTGGGNSTSARYYYTIYRDIGGTETDLGNGGNGIRTHEQGANGYQIEDNQVVSIQDAPNTTSSVSYHLKMKVQSGTGYINTNGTGLGTLIEYI